MFIVELQILIFPKVVFLVTYLEYPTIGDWVAIYSSTKGIRLQSQDNKTVLFQSDSVSELSLYLFRTLFLFIIILEAQYTKLCTQ